jgi:hypothetical protein
VTCEVLPFDNVRRSDANDESEVPGLTGLQAVHSTVIDESDMNNDWQVGDLHVCSVRVQCVLKCG